MSSLLLILGIFGLSYADEQCQWDISVNHKAFTLDLQRLQNLNASLQCALHSQHRNPHLLSWFTAGWTLQYTPCRNGISCNESLSMVSKIAGNRSFPRCAAFLGVWDSGRTQPLFVEHATDNREQYVFQYRNEYREPFGNCSNGHLLNVTYLCDEDIDTYSESNISCHELTPSNGTCIYEMVIPTKLACLGAITPSQNNESSALHASVWMTIIFAAVFMFYCISGYILNATRYGKWTDILGNVPNANLWCFCCYEKRAYVQVRVKEGDSLIQDQF